MSRMPRKLLVAACAVALVSSVASAQAIGGRVVDSASARPISGVLVVLLDSANVTRGQDLTDASGAWHLSATPGTYRLRTLRIGFRPFTSAPFRVTAGASVLRDLVVDSRPVQLDTVRVAARDPCRSRPESGATFEVWEQARTAIAAAQLTARGKGYDAAMLTYEQTVSPDRAKTTDRSARVSSGHTLRPWVTLSLDSIRKMGYVYRRGDGAMIYNAPDLELLLSDDFAADHCFRVTREAGGGRRVGLEFEPTRERVVPEIRGTVWLDAKSAHLQQFEFRYVNIDPQLERGGAGGEMTFARFANGGWSISRWDIRMPVVRLERQPSLSVPGRVAPTSGVDYQLVGTRVAGGELVLVTRGADTLWSGTRRRLAGTILDSATGKGVRGAIRIDQLNAGVNADGQGRFSIPEVLPGTYVASVIDATGGTHKRTFTFVDETTPVVFRVAPAPEKTLWRLDTVVVAAISGDRPGTIPEFEARRARGVGRFLTAEQLRDLDDRPFTDVLRTKFPDLALKFTERAEVHLYNRRQQPPKALLQGGTYCYVQIITDGVLQFAMGGADPEPPDFAGVQTRNFDAVEYYASVAATPPEYRNDGATCGTLVLWSRRQ